MRGRRPELSDKHPVHVVLRIRHRVTDRRALSHGMQSFAINAARAFHAVDGGCGKVFEYRYYSTQIKTPRYARHALAYVLNNWRRHRLDFENGRQLTRKLDPYSSAISFQGWTERFAVPRGYEPLPVSPPATRLLARDWSRYGPIDPEHRPGPLAWIS